MSAGNDDVKGKMEKAEEELERRSKFLNSLILKKKAIVVEEKQEHEHLNVRVRASDMPLSLQNHAFRCARDNLDATIASGSKLDSKHLALLLKKVLLLDFLFMLLNSQVLWFPWILHSGFCFDLSISTECVFKVSKFIVVCWMEKACSGCSMAIFFFCCDK